MFLVPEKSSIWFYVMKPCVFQGGSGAAHGRNTEFLPRTMLLQVHSQHRKQCTIGHQLFSLHTGSESVFLVSVYCIQVTCSNAIAGNKLQFVSEM